MQIRKLSLYKITELVNGNNPNISVSFVNHTDKMLNESLSLSYF